MTVGLPSRPRLRHLVVAVLGATVVVACASRKPAPRPLPPNVRQAPDGSCWYYPPVNCPPPPMTCEAPPPQRVACPR